ncbi:uncharacterized protein LOC124455960 [Xenia sp. Carnegie-2017]|uniref:uncharacterized protein LOC124455960 n=1 Tax=Xenia sp. Carnegie-2017 TaxID=2897299 RepID=UPI001F04090C|nr:uncharacterized protein LOC124455960 [Xenia sp. Carnegie-2017]
MCPLDLFLKLLENSAVRPGAVFSVLWRWVSDETAGVDTLGAVVADLHTGGPGLMVAFVLTEAAVNSSSTWESEQLSLGMHCSPHMRKGIEKVTLITLGTWTVRTLRDYPSSDRTERRTALVARELARYNIDIAALSETRFANEGQLTEYGGGYTFFWSGRSADEHRESGVGFAIRNHLVQKLANIPKGTNDRLMLMQIHLYVGKRATLISAYAPTLTNPEDVKDRFNEDLDTMLSSVRSIDKLILIGDFNARVGRDSAAWDGVIGKSGEQNMDAPPVETLASHRLHHCQEENRQDVRITKAMCGAECWTDNRLIISKMNICIKRKRRPQGCMTKKRINVTKLKNHQTIAALSTDLESQIANFNPGVQVLGYPSRHQHDWFDENDEEIQVLLDEKHRLHRAYQDDPTSVYKKNAFASARRTVQSKLRAMRDSWLSAKADEIQAYADRNDTKRFYEALNTIYGPRSSGNSPVLSSDGTSLITEKEKILHRWAEHFEAVLNRPSSINDEAIDRLPQVNINTTMDVPPVESEVREAINKLSSGKAPGADAIPSEIYKVGGPTIIQKLTDLFQSFWAEGKVSRAEPRSVHHFVDLTKAFDTVSRQALWRIMCKVGCPEKFILMVRQFHDGMLARVLVDGDYSEPFPVTNGV